MHCLRICALCAVALVEARKKQAPPPPPPETVGLPVIFTEPVYSWAVGVRAAAAARALARPYPG